MRGNRDDLVRIAAEALHAQGCHEGCAEEGHPLTEYMADAAAVIAALARHEAETGEWEYRTNGQPPHMVGSWTPTKIFVPAEATTWWVERRRVGPPKRVPSVAPDAPVVSDE